MPWMLAGTMQRPIDNGMLANGDPPSSDICRGSDATPTGGDDGGCKPVRPLSRAPARASAHADTLTLTLEHTGTDSDTDTDSSNGNGNGTLTDKCARISC